MRVEVKINDIFIIIEDQIKLCEHLSQPMGVFSLRKYLKLLFTFGFNLKRNSCLRNKTPLSRFHRFTVRRCKKGGLKPSATFRIELLLSTFSVDRQMSVGQMGILFQGKWRFCNGISHTPLSSVTEIFH